MANKYKKHIYSDNRGSFWLTLPGTLCGFPDKDNQLVAKEGEEVTCLVCLRISKGEPRYKRQKTKQH